MDKLNSILTLIFIDMWMIYYFIMFETAFIFLRQWKYGSFSVEYKYIFNKITLHLLQDNFNTESFQHIYPHNLWLHCMCRKTEWVPSVLKFFFQDLFQYSNCRAFLVQTWGINGQHLPTRNTAGFHGFSVIFSLDIFALHPSFISE